MIHAVHSCTVQYVAACGRIHDRYGATAKAYQTAIHKGCSPHVLCLDKVVDSERCLS